MTSPDTKPLILVTGATGYIGGRLFPRLTALGYLVRCMAREPSHVRRQNTGVEVVKADIRNPDEVQAALHGVHTAYYLIHSMGSAGNFEHADAEAAAIFGAAAKAEGVKHIIYLGGLGDEQTELSPHLKSRHEVGRILQSFDVPVTEFRASIIIGSGSLSFEMIRALVERLPFMITPRWVDTKAQPIAIQDVLNYLLQAAGQPTTQSRIFEIGGNDQVSYRDLMMAYAEARGLKRTLISVPVLSPRLSSLWLGLVTPLYARVGRKLVDSLKYPTICHHTEALTEFTIQPMGYRDAIREALRNEDQVCAETRWSDSLSAVGTPRTWAGLRFGNRLVDTRRVNIPLPPERAFVPIQRIGGDNGWYYANTLWQLRGAIDLLFGGPGMRRGRRDPVDLKVGDTLDCWRVEAIDAPGRLRLKAEMKLPGRAWLEFMVEGDSKGSTITQTASFDPLGLPGILYWYSVYPLHELIFSGMLKSIARSVIAGKSFDTGTVKVKR